MINEKQVRRYCCEDISKIENYEEAVNDKSQVWSCHHRGEILPCGRYSHSDLIKFDLYWKRPANELIFMPRSEHRSLHHKGKVITEAQRKQISNKLLGQIIPEETRKKIARALKGKCRKPLSEEHKRKLSKAHIGIIPWIYGKKMKWITNGIEEHIVEIETPIPKGYTTGRIKKRTK